MAQSPTGRAPASTVPNRKTKEADLDKWNDGLRASPVYQQFVADNHITGKKDWTKEQQKRLEQVLRNNGSPVPDGMHIDSGGNLNQKNHLKRNIAIATAVVATAYFAGPAAYAAMAGSSAPAAGAAGATALGAGVPASTALGAGSVLASSSIPTAALMGGAGAVTSAGVSAGVPLLAGGGSALLASSSLPTAALMSGAPSVGAGAAAPLASSSLPASSLMSGAPSVASGAAPAGSGTTAAVGGGSKMLGMTNAELIQLGLSTAKGISDSRAQAGATAQTREQTALQESLADPFRAASSQARQLKRLDRATNTTARVRGVDANGYPVSTGGQYNMSPELAQWLTELRNRIATGAAQNPGQTPGYKTGVQNITQNTSGVPTSSALGGGGLAVPRINPLG